MEPGSIHTERLILIPVTSKVAYDLALGSNRELEEMGLQTNGRWPRQDTLDILPFVTQAFQENPESTGFEFWMVVLKESMTIIGDIGFHGIPDDQGIIEIGYGLIEEAQRKGYGYEALQAMMDWAKSHEDVTAIRADCLVTNVPSIRVLEKSGMKRIHRDRNTIYWEHIK
ncbi:MAG TPA: GNAT family N-acetyltransferase [Clostridiaceae bacterium]|nr:GNAT family N-acetyltransferase [Clostridiaceae bacterium]